MSTLTSYQSLLLDYEPRPIRSEAAYRKALRHVEKLMRPRLSRAESELVEVLATLIEQYESPRTPHAEESSARNAGPSDGGPRGGASRGGTRNRHPPFHDQRRVGRAARLEHRQHRRALRLLPRLPRRADGTPGVEPRPKRSNPFDPHSPRPDPCSPCPPLASSAPAATFPTAVVTNFDLTKMMETSDEFIVERTGVRRRRRAEPDMAASDLAAPACRDAVADAGPDHGPDRHGDHEHDHPRSRRSGLRVLPAGQARPARHPRVRHQAAMRGLDLRAVAGRPLRAGRHLSPRAGRLQRSPLHADRRLLRRPEHRHPAWATARGPWWSAPRPTASAESSPPSCTPTADTPRPCTRRPRAADWAARSTSPPDDIEAGRVHFRMDGKAVFQNGVEKMSDAVFESPAGQRPDAGRHRRAGAAPGQPPHAGGDRRPTGHPAGKGLRERRGLRQHRLGLAAHRLARSRGKPA